MDLLRVSTTAIESFRLFSSPDQEWMPEEDLIASIKGEWRPSAAARLGGAFGRILEDPDRYVHAPDAVDHDGPNNGYLCDGHFFRYETILEARAAIPAPAAGVYESKATKVYGDMLVVSKADRVLGADLDEFKATLNSFDADKYITSCQWRFMVDMYQPRRVRYFVFLLSEEREPGDGYRLRGVEILPLYPYPALQTDLSALLGDFRHYVKARGLEDVLRQRQRQAEARAGAIA